MLRFRLAGILLLAFTVALGVTACHDDVLVSLPRDEEDEDEDEDPEPEPDPDPEPEPPPVTSGDDCQDDADCGPNAACESGTCVGVGNMRVTLSFAPDSDYDLHVFTPDGLEIYYGNPNAGGGLLDVDTCVGLCDSPGTHVENVFFNDAPPVGPYSAHVENYDGRQGGFFRIEVSGAADAVLEGSLEAFSGARSDDLDWFVD